MYSRHMAPLLSYMSHVRCTYAMPMSMYFVWVCTDRVVGEGHISYVIAAIGRRVGPRVSVCEDAHAARCLRKELAIAN